MNVSPQVPGRAAHAARPSATPPAVPPSRQAQSDGPPGGIYDTLRQILGGVAGTVTDTVVAGFGVETNLTTLAAMRSVSGAFISTGFVPAAAAQLFEQHAYTGYRLAAPALDMLSLANTWKTARARSRHDGDPPPTGALGAPTRGGAALGIAVDAAHLAVDTVVAASIVGSLTGLPGLALMSPGFALSLGFVGDVVAGVVHGVSSASALSNPSNGDTFAKRWERLVLTQGIDAVVGRVFLGREPLESGTHTAGSTATGHAGTPPQAGPPS